MQNGMTPSGATYTFGIRLRQRTRDLGFGEAPVLPGSFPAMATPCSGQTVACTTPTAGQTIGFGGLLPICLLPLELLLTGPGTMVEFTGICTAFYPKSQFLGFAW